MQIHMDLLITENVKIPFYPIETVCFLVDWLRCDANLEKLHTKSMWKFFESKNRGHFQCKRVCSLLTSLSKTSQQQQQQRPDSNPLPFVLYQRHFPSYLVWKWWLFHNMCVASVI